MIIRHAGLWSQAKVIAWECPVNAELYENESWLQLMNIQLDSREPHLYK